MTDIQVSKARRIGFTALAVLAFWLLAMETYSAGCAKYLVGRVHAPGPMRLLPRWVLPLCLAMLPLVLLALATVNSPRRLPFLWFGTAGVLFYCVYAHNYHLGLHDVVAGNRAYFLIRAAGSGYQVDAAMQHHGTSWLLLLLPMILTTAFVSFGAWRWARDAATEPVDDDE